MDDLTNDEIESILYIAREISGTSLSELLLRHLHSDGPIQCTRFLRSRRMKDTVLKTGAI